MQDSARVIVTAYDRRSIKKPDRMERPGFLGNVCHPQLRGLLPYLLLQGAGLVQHCLWEQAPRVRIAATRATTAAILVMVMEYFASFLGGLLLKGIYARSVHSQMKKPDRMNGPAFGKV